MVLYANVSQEREAYASGRNALPDVPLGREIRHVHVIDAPPPDVREVISDNGLVVSSVELLVDELREPALVLATCSSRAAHASV